MQKKAGIIFIIIILFIIGSVVALSFSKKIKENPEGTIGNTAGNLNGHGLYCENDGKIYFANPYDNDHLYSMNSDLSEATEILGLPVEYINAAGKYLYFNQKDSKDNKIMGLTGRMHGVYRVEKTGTNITCLDKTVVGISVLADNDIYYQHYDNNEGMTLYRVSTDKTEKEQVSKSIINPSCIVNGTIYYPDLEKKCILSQYQTDAKIEGNISGEQIFNPVYQGGYLYYMKVDDNYKLYRMSLGENVTMKLTDDRIDCFNVLGDYIYYQKNSQTTPQLKRMRIDGSNPEVIMNGNFTDINMTSTYTFFSPFDSPVPVYCLPTYGPLDVRKVEFPIKEHE